MIMDFIKARGKSFMAAFLAALLAATFAGLEAAGLPLSDAFKGSISTMVMGIAVSNTANSLMSSPANGWGANLKEIFFQIVMAILAFVGIGAAT